MSERMTLTHWRRLGFTLIDLTVAISIFMTIAVILVLNFRAGRSRDELKEGALTVAGYIEQAQAYALAGRTFDNGGMFTVPRGGWGVHVDDQFKTSFIFFSDHQPAPNNPDYILTGDDVQEEVVMPSKVEIEDLCVDEIGLGLDCTFTVVDYVLSPPYAERHINQNPSTNRGGFTVQLRHLDTNKTVTVTVTATTGLVTIGDIN